MFKCCLKIIILATGKPWTIYWDNKNYFKMEGIDENFFADTLFNKMTLFVYRRDFFPIFASRLFGEKAHHEFPFEFSNNEEQRSNKNFQPIFFPWRNYRLPYNLGHESFSTCAMLEKHFAASSWTNHIWLTVHNLNQLIRRFKALMDRSTKKSEDLLKTRLVTFCNYCVL